jgi:hypothetical protein
VGLTTIDPHAEKYYDWSPYAYCMDNPLKYVDPDGKATRIYVETQWTGHAFVTIGSGKNTVVYTYGRYGAVNNSSSTSSRLSPNGEGVLIKLTGQKALDYITKEIHDNGAKVYEITNANDKKTSEYLDKQFNSSQKQPSSGDHQNDKDAHVIDQYDLSNNNCTTKTIEAVSAGTDEKFDVKTTTPDGLETKLSNKTDKKDTNIKQVYYEDIKKEYQSK